MKRILIPLLALASMTTLAAAPVSYRVSVDTSSIGTSTPGYIEFQFNQANASTSLPATANVTDFNSNGFTFDDALDAVLGGATGSLSAPPLVFDNTVGGTNLFDEGVTTFGTGFSFVVTLEGAALGTSATDGSQFFVFLLARDYSSLAGGTDGVGGLTLNGDTTITTNAMAGLSTVTTYTAPSSETPETSALVLFGIGAAALVARRSSCLS